MYSNLFENEIERTISNRNIIKSVIDLIKEVKVFYIKNYIIEKNTL